MYKGDSVGNQSGFETNVRMNVGDQFVIDDEKSVDLNNLVVKGVL